MFAIESDITSEKSGHRYKLKLPKHREVQEWKKKNPDYLFDFIMQAGDLCIDKSEEVQQQGYLPELLAIEIADDVFVEKFLMVTAPYLGHKPDVMRKYIDAMKKVVSKGEENLPDIAQKAAEGKLGEDTEELAKN